MPPKIECKIELWWINSALLRSETGCSIYGEIFGHPAFGEGEFVVLNLTKADFIHQIVETDDAYIKLGEPQTLDNVMTKFTKKGGDSNG